MSLSRAIAALSAFTMYAIILPEGGAKTFQSEPQYLVSPPEIDFGTFKASEIVSGELVSTVKIKNMSQTLMEISDVRADCSCTTPKLSTKRLAPGEEAEMTVGLKLAGIAGRKTSHVVVRLSDGQLIPVPVTIVVVEKIQASIESLKLTVSQGEVLSPDIVVVKPIDAIPESEDNVTVVADHVPVSVAKLESVSQMNSGAVVYQTRVTLRLCLSGLALGTYRGSVRAKFLHGGELAIPYDIEVKAPVRVERVFPPVISESTKTVKLVVFHPADSLGIDAVRINGNNCVFKVDRDDKTSVVDIVIPESAEKKDLSGTVAVRLSEGTASLSFDTPFVK